MKTVIYEIDTKAIKGFGEAQIDPIATNQIVKPILYNSDEVKDLRVKQSQLKSINLAKFKAKFDSDSVFFMAAKRLKMSDRDMSFLLVTDPSLAKSKFNASEIKRFDTNIKLMQQREKEAEDLMKTFEPLIKIIKNKEKSLIINKAIYFIPHVGENIITDVKYNNFKTKISNLAEREKLTIDEVVIAAPPLPAHLQPQ